MKVLHRAKALAAYDGANLALKQGLTYPSYMLLKESVRGTLSYIIEDSEEREIADKTKLCKLIDWVDDNLVSSKDKQKLMELVEAESGGLEKITSMDIEELKEIKTVTKKLIGTNLRVVL